jgi:hypothetical protein
VLDALERIAAQERNAADLRALALKRRNVAWYQRHAAELAPLFRGWRAE